MIRRKTIRQRSFFCHPIPMAAPAFMLVDKRMKLGYQHIGLSRSVRFIQDVSKKDL